jgi:hypothetical protein
MMSRILTVNIDLDDLRFYRGIHALPQRPEMAEIFVSGVPRFLDLCEKHGICATLFTISEDLKIPAARAAIADAAARGHEIASHSKTHSYAVSKADAETIKLELTESKAELERACGKPVVGFRGPGYNLSPAILDALVAAGYTYDTSIMSSPPYWMARAAIITAMKLTGKTSASIVGRARDFFRSRKPFVWHGNGEGLREYPITTGGPLMMPLIGTTMAGNGLLTRQLVNAASRLDFVNIEFHGIDFLDIEGDGLERELLVEPALKIPLETRLANFDRYLSILSSGRECPSLGSITTF